MTNKEQLENFVLKFRKWLSDNYSKEDIERNFYDDAGYPYWVEIENYFSRLLGNGELGQLDNADKVNLLYLIARHWDIGSMINWMTKEKQLSNLGNLESADFIDLAQVLVDLKSNEFDDAKIQFVSSFKKFDTLTPKIENILLKFYHDDEIDIKGRALLSLGKLNYPKIKELLEQLWKIDDEQNRIKCLSLIDEYIQDKDLMIEYLNGIATDVREPLSQYVKILKRKYGQKLHLTVCLLAAGVKSVIESVPHHLLCRLTGKCTKQAVADQLKQSIATTEARIDSLRNLTPEYATRYEGYKPTDITAIVVKCHYRYVMPGTTEAKERTDNFVLTPDGKKVVGKVVKTGD